MNQHVLSIKITGDGSNFTVEADKAEKAAGRVSSSVAGIEKSATSLTSAVGRLGQALGVALSVREFAHASDAWATLDSRIKLATGSIQDAAGGMSAVFNIAQKSGQELSAIGDIFSKVSRNARQYNLDQAGVISVTQDIANAMRLSGGAAGSASAALMQFGQSLSSGQLRGEELNSVLEQAPALAEAIARGLGKTTGELKKMGEDGLLPMKDVLQAIRNESARLEEEAGQMANTITAATQRLSNSWQKFVGTEGSAAASAMAGGIDLLAKNIDTAAVSVAALGTAWTGLKVSGWVSELGGVAGVFGRFHPAVALATGALVAGNIVWKDWKSMADLATESTENASAAARKLANDLSKALTEISSMTQKAYDLTLAQSAVERAKAAKANDSAQSKLGGFTGNKVSDEYIEISTAARKAANDLADADTKLSKFIEGADRVGSKQYDTFLDKFSGKAFKSAKDVADATKLFKDAWNALDGTPDAASKRQVLQTQFNAWKSEKLGDKSASEFKSISEAAKQYAQELEGAIDKGDKLTRGEKSLSEAKRKLSASQYELVRATLEGNVAKEKEVAAFEASKKKLKEQAEAIGKLVTEEHRHAESILKQNESISDEIQTLGKSVEEQARYKAQKLENTAATLKLDAAVLDAAANELEASNQLPEIAKKYRELAQAKRESAIATDAQAGLVLERSAAQVAADQAKASLEVWKDFSRDVERSLTDSLMRSFEAGNDAGTVFAKNLINTFKAMALKLSIQATVNTVTNAVGLGNAATQANSLLGLNTSYASGFGNFATSSFGQQLGLSNAVISDAGPALEVSQLGQGIQAGLPYLPALFAASQGNFGSAAGSAIGAYFGGPVGSLVGSALGGLLDGGGGEDPHNNPSRYYLSFGANKEGIYGTTKAEFGSKGIAAPNYTVGGKTSGSGWWGDSWNLDVSQVKTLNDSVVKTFSDAYKSADILGINKSIIDDISVTVKKGAASEIAKTFEGAFTKALGDISNEIANTLLPSISDFKIGTEDAATTFNRLIAETSSVKDAFQVMGMSFGATGTSAVKLADAIVQATGGLDKFTASFSAYYDNFYSESEKHANSIKQLSQSFADLGYSLPVTKEGFRAIVDSLDLTTSSGQKTFAALIGLQSAFSQVADQSKRITEDAVSAALKGLSASVEAEQKKAQATFETQSAALEASYAAAQKAASIQIAAAQKTATAIGSLADSLQLASKQITADSEASLLAKRDIALKTLNDALSLGKSGQSVLPMAEAINDAILTLQKPSEQLYSSFEEYATAQTAANTALTQLAAIGKSQSTVADLTLQALQSAGEQAKDQFELSQRQLQTNLDAEISKYDQMLASYQEQVNVLLGIDDSIKTIPDAISTLKSAIENLAAAKQGSSSATSSISKQNNAPTGADLVTVVPQAETAPIGTIYKNTPKAVDLSGIYAQTAETIAAEASAAAAVQAANVQAPAIDFSKLDTLTIPGFASGGTHEGGWRVVGEVGMELEYTGPSRIINNTDTRSLLARLNSDSGSNGNTEAEIRALRQEQQDQAAAFAGFMARCSKVLEKWDVDGMPEMRDMA